MSHAEVTGERGPGVLPLLLGGVLVALAAQVRRGTYDNEALVMVVVATVLLAFGVGRGGRLRRTRATRVAVTGAVLVQLVATLPLLYEALAGESNDVRVMATVLWAVLGVLALDLVAERPALPPWARTVFVGVVGALGLVWLASLYTTIDVLMFSQVGAEQLLSGANPYDYVYPNPYGEAGTAAFYGPGLGEPDGLLNFGYPYPPLPLLMALPGALLGDVRYAHLAVVLVAGWLLLHRDRGADPWAARVGGVLVLTTPTLMPLVQRAYTEDMLLLGLVLYVWVSHRHGRWVPVALGLFMAAKQYAVLLLPVVLVLSPRLRTWPERWRVTWQAGLVAAAVTLPFALWDLGRFVFSVGLLQFQQPFRGDAMSLPAAAVRLLEWDVQAYATPLMFVAIVVATALVVRRGERSLAGLCLGIAVVMLAFLLFSKQAFTNYYTFVVWAAWVGMTFRDPAPDPADVAPTATPAEVTSAV